MNSELELPCIHCVPFRVALFVFLEMAVRPSDRPRPLRHKNSIKNTSRGEEEEGKNRKEGRKEGRKRGSTNRRMPLHSSNDDDGRISLSSGHRVEEEFSY